MARKISTEARKQIKALVAHYEANQSLFKKFLEQFRIAVVESQKLTGLIHSLKWRTKDPAHLKDKLLRKAEKVAAEGGEFTMSIDQLFQQITDLAGLRILHLHTRQMKDIHAALMEVISEEQYVLKEGPIAKTWDDEYREFFSSIKIETEPNNRLYTSVHYIIESNAKTRLPCEVQVRTLAEEVWGEVDHSMNYPHPITSVACKEQIRVLARVTSGCTRLVDAIFLSRDEAGRLKAELKAARVKSKGLKKGTK